MYYYDDVDDKYYRYFHDNRNIIRREITHPNPDNIKHEFSIRYLNNNHIINVLNSFKFGWENGIIACEESYNNHLTSGVNAREFKFTLPRSIWMKFEMGSYKGNEHAYAILHYLYNEGYELDESLVSCYELSRSYARPKIYNIGRK